MRRIIMERYYDLPEDTQEALDNYVKYGHCGHFILAVVENNLIQAYNRADADNVAHMQDIVRYVYNKMPSDCWGSKDKVEKWIDARIDERLVTEENS